MFESFVVASTDTVFTLNEDRFCILVSETNHHQPRSSSVSCCVVTQQKLLSQKIQLKYYSMLHAGFLHANTSILKMDFSVEKSAVLLAVRSLSVAVPAYRATSS